MNIKPKNKKECQICNKVFFVSPSRASGLHERKLCGMKCSAESLRLRKPMLGKKHSEKTKEIISKRNKSKIAWNKNLIGFRLGEKHDWMPLGANHWSWKGGISKNVHSTSEPRYKKWRMSVFTRDNFKCRIHNEECKGQLQAHHILPWRDFENLRYEINNGIALCLAHHPRKRAEEKRLAPIFQGLVSVSKYNN